MSDYDIIQMNTMRKDGLGYENVGFCKRDMYNEVEKQRLFQFSDATNVMVYLKQLN